MAMKQRKARKPLKPKKGVTRATAVAAGFRSGLEYEIAKDLISRGIKFEYEKHRIPYQRVIVGGKCGDCSSGNVRKRATYTPDLYLLGVRRFIEIKGRLTSTDRTKLCAVLPEFAKRGETLSILFSQDNFTTKLKRERYSGWAARNGFQYAVGKTIPNEWTA
jgi:hypothetical protein